MQPFSVIANQLNVLCIYCLMMVDVAFFCAPKRREKKNPILCSLMAWRNIFLVTYKEFNFISPYSFVITLMLEGIVFQHGTHAHQLHTCSFAS